MEGWRGLVITLTLFFKRGQRIELSPQQEREAWPELGPWRCCGVLAADVMFAGLGKLGRKGRLSVDDWCTGMYRSAEARSAHTMSPTASTPPLVIPTVMASLGDGGGWRGDCAEQAELTAQRLM